MTPALASSASILSRRANDATALRTESRLARSSGSQLIRASGMRAVIAAAAAAAFAGFRAAMTTCAPAAASCSEVK